MRRAAWFAVGVAVTVVVVWQGRKLYRKLTPETELREALGIDDTPPPAEFVPVQARRAARA